MKTISRYIMTLALLITAVGGAWAADTYTVAGSNSDMFGAAWDAYAAANDMTKNGDGTYSITYTNVYLDGNVQYKVVKNRDWEEAYPADGNRVITIAEPGFYTVTIHFNPTTHEVYETMPGSGSDEPDVEVTTNAASEQDLFTEASFKMPTFDVDVNYTLVRDMQDEANPVAFSGLPSSGNIVVKKGDDGKYQPAETLNLQLIDPLAAAEAQNIIGADGITIKVLVGNGGTPIEYDQDNPITLEAFLADMKPGYYWIKAEPTDENSHYDGTVYSSEFTVVEQYDLTVKPANDFSKGKIESVTVGTETVTPDATTGEATKTGIAPETEVKIKAKHGYIIEKVEAKKGIAPAPITVTWNSDDIPDDSEGNSFTKGDVTITAGGIEFLEKSFYDGGTFTTTRGNFTKIEVTANYCGVTGTGWSGNSAKMTWTGNASSVSFSGYISGLGDTKFVFTIEPKN